VTLGADAKTVLLAPGAMFLIALALGVWKHQRMTTSEDHLAHPYVDTAHRAALLYSFATLLVATFVQFSGWNEPVDLISAGVLCFFIFSAVGGYVYHGVALRHRQSGPRSLSLSGRTDRGRAWRLLDPARRLHGRSCSPVVERDASLTVPSAPGSRSRGLD
jgi:hypothetical protein